MTFRQVLMAMEEEASVAVKVVREVERKFATPESFEVPDLAGAGPVSQVADPVRGELLAVYYDTADLRLAREGITLRRRAGGADAGWHLKLPVSRSARDEVQLPLSAGEDGEVPAELADLVTAYTRRSPLEAVAILRTQREVHVLRDSDGKDLGQLASDDVSVLQVGAEDVQHARVLGRFRELELEERAGDEDGRADASPDLGEVVRRLLTAGAIAGGLVPKVMRALGPLASASPDVPVPPSDLSLSSPAADLVRAHIATQVRALRAADVGVRRDQDDAVHQMRVAARRLRSGLRVFRPLLERAWADDLRAELGWLAGELGRARDGEVLAARLDAAVGALPEQVDTAAVGTFVDHHLAEDVQDARAGALAALRSARYALLVEQLVSAANLPATTAAAAQPCAVALPPLVATAWRRLARQAGALRLDGADEDWHEARKSAKAVRYAAEAVAPVTGRPAKRLARQVERVTELLGDHQDAAVAATALTGLLATPRTSARVAFGLGVLYAAQRRDVAGARRDFLQVWGEVAHDKHRTWLKTKP